MPSPSYLFDDPSSNAVSGVVFSAPSPQVAQAIDVGNYRFGPWRLHSNPQNHSTLRFKHEKDGKGNTEGEIGEGWVKQDELLYFFGWLFMKGFLVVKLFRRLFVTLFSGTFGG